MRWAGLTAVVIALVAASPAHAAPGDIDRHYSHDGFALLGLPTQSLYPGDMTLDSSGRVVFAGETSIGPPGGGSTMALGRLLGDGRPDPRFGDGGIVLTPALGTYGNSGLVDDVVTDAQDRILIAGQTATTAFIARYSQQGQLDSTFGQSGMAAIGPSGMSSDVRDLTVLGSGRIAFAGTASSPSAPDHLLVGELLDDGSAASDFASGGTYLGAFEPGVAARGSQVLENPRDGSLMVAGRSGVKLAALALTRTGVPRSDYGEAGAVTWGIGLGPNLPLGGDIADDVASAALDASGRLLVAGSVCEEGARFGYCNRLVSRLKATGSLDTSFADNGFLIRENEVDLVGIAVDRAGRILIGTTGQLPGIGSPQGYNFSLLRLTAAGIPDRTFSRDGEASVDHAFAYESADAMAVDARGRVLIGGTGGNRIASTFAPFRFEVGRFTMRAGPRDADGDRVLDRADRCRFNFARRRDGCPLVDRYAYVEAGTQRDFRVVVGSPLSECAGEVRVALYAAGPGQDERVAAGSTDLRGRWEGDLPRSIHNVYAVVPTSRVPNAAVCPTVRSDPVRISRRSAT